jgi:hypothetical protein
VDYGGKRKLRKTRRKTLSTQPPPQKANFGQFSVGSNFLTLENLEIDPNEVDRLRGHSGTFLAGKAVG